MTRPAYTVNAERTSDGWWYLEAPEVEGAMTQAKRLDQAEAMARDVIALLLDVPHDSFEVDIVPYLAEDESKLLKDARAARRRSTEADDEARVAVKQAVVALAGRGFPQRDIGVLLGVTHQRVAQIMGGVPVTRRLATKRVAAARGRPWRPDDDVSRSDMEPEADDMRPAR